MSKPTLLGGVSLSPVVEGTTPVVDEKGEVKQQEEEEYTVVGNFDRLERATSAVKDANTIIKSKSGGLSQNEAKGQVSKTKEKN